MNLKVNTGRVVKTVIAEPTDVAEVGTRGTIKYYELNTGHV